MKGYVTHTAAPVTFTQIDTQIPPEAVQQPLTREARGAAVKIVTNEREARRQSLKQSPRTFLGGSLQQGIIP